MMGEWNEEAIDTIIETLEPEKVEQDPQGTVFRNAQLRFTHIVYCILWEECKQTQCPHRN